MHLKYPSKISSFDLIFPMIFSSYPLILCMELQCCINQQERVAQLLIDIFGEKLFLDNLFLSADKNITSRSLPSPNDLRGKIIIKVKQSVFILFCINEFSRVKNYLHVFPMKLIENMEK